MFKSVLVAYDGSPSSRAALVQAYELAESEDAEVTVLTVAPTVAPLAALAPDSIVGRREELDRGAARMLQEAEAAAPEGLTVRAAQRSGHVGEQIVAEIESGAYD